MKTETENRAKENAEAYYQNIEKLTRILKQAEEKNHDNFADVIREKISEEPLEVSTAKTYTILLSWGGPSLRIYGELNEYNEPETAKLQYQDWFTGWEELPCNEEVLLEYAKNFYYGE